jgi:hypothetical protein
LLFSPTKLVGGFVGTLYGSCVQLWYPQPTQEHPIKKLSTAIVKTELPRTWSRGLGRHAFWCALVGASFTAAECLAEAARNKRDSLNAGFGGAVAGAVIGSTFRRADLVAASAIGCGILMFGTDLSFSTFEASKAEQYHKIYGTLPEKHEDSAALKALKEKYQKFKDN